MGDFAEAIETRIRSSSTDVTRIAGHALTLPRRELRILEYMVSNHGKWITKTQIFNAVYGIFESTFDESVIESHVSKLRKKLRDRRLGFDAIDGPALRRIPPQHPGRRDHRRADAGTRRGRHPPEQGTCRPGGVPAERGEAPCENGNGLCGVPFAEAVAAFSGRDGGTAASRCRRRDSYGFCWNCFPSKHS